MPSFLSEFSGELRAATAFMQGDLRLAGDMQKALALEEVLKAARLQAEEEARQIRQQQPQQKQQAAASFHTSASLGYADPPPAAYKTVPEVFDRIKTVANEDIVKQVQSVYVFDVEGEFGRGGRGFFFRFLPTPGFLNFRLQYLFVCPPPPRRRGQVLRGL